MKYVSNLNGDWWLVEDHVELYVLDLDNLSPEDLAKVSAHGIEDDKFEDVIHDYGLLYELEIK